MEKSRINLRNKNEKNKEIENFRIKNENYHLNDSHFLFDEQKSKSNNNLTSNIIIENINSNEYENNDDEEDKKEEEFILKEILSNLNKNENETKDDKSCKEIIDILKKPIIDNKAGVFVSPFKPLLKPKKISMEGRILYNVYNINNNNAN
jgi:hypothetical protein